MFVAEGLTLVVVSEVVSLHLRHVLRQPRVVQGVVHTVVEDVEGECAGNDTVRDSRREDEVGELGERCFEGKEKGGWHDKTQSVHREVVVDTV